MTRSRSRFANPSATKGRSRTSGSPGTRRGRRPQLWRRRQVEASDAAIVRLGVPTAWRPTCARARGRRRPRPASLAPRPIRHHLAPDKRSPGISSPQALCHLPRRVVFHRIAPCPPSEFSNPRHRAAIASAQLASRLTGR